MNKSTIFWRVVLGVTFIMLLFYSNLLMGEYEHSGIGYTRGFALALKDIFTISNFIIGIISAFIGYLIFEFLRNKL